MNLDADDYQTIIRLSSMILAAVAVVIISIIALRMKQARDERDREALDPERIRVEMESLARMKLAERTGSTAASEMGNPSEDICQNTEKTTDNEEYVEGEPLA